MTDVLLDLSIDSEFQAEFKGDGMDIDPYYGRRDPAVPVRRARHLGRRAPHCHFIVQGAYPTDLLEWAVREHVPLISYEHAHYLLSRLPAHMAGLTDRGTLRERRSGRHRGVRPRDHQPGHHAGTRPSAPTTGRPGAGGGRRRPTGLYYTLVNVVR